MKNKSFFDRFVFGWLLIVFFAAIFLYEGMAKAELLPYDQRPQTSAYISTGDCLWFAHLTPVGSRESIQSVFDAWQKVYKVNRIFWRGMQSQVQLNHFSRSFLNPIYDTAWVSELKILKFDDLDTFAVKAAHERGMEFWGTLQLFDFGGNDKTGVFDTLPPYASGEDELLSLYPECAPVDKRGHRKGSGTICFAYPKVRQILALRLANIAAQYQYDGVMLMTYVENFSQRFNDEFGYNEPIVTEFKKRYGIDIRHEKFDKTLWHKLRGEYVTEFLKELHGYLQKGNRKLGVILYERDLHYPSPWFDDNKVLPAGNVYLNWEKWIEEGIVDELQIKQHNGENMGGLLTQLLDTSDKAGGKCTISFMTPSFEQSHWKPYTDRGAGVVFGDGAVHVDRGYPDAYPIEALKGDDPYAKMTVLELMIKRVIAPSATAIISATKDHNLLVKRKALMMIGKLTIQEGLPALYDALKHPLPSIRGAGFYSLATVYDKQTPSKVLSAIRKNTYYYSVVNSARECLSKLPDDIFTTSLDAMNDDNPEIRMIVPWAIFRSTTGRNFSRLEALPSLLNLLKNDTDMRVRYCAAWALQRYNKAEVVTALMEASTNDLNIAVQQRAVASIIQSAKPYKELLTPQQQQVLLMLQKRFREFHFSSARFDRDWGWRTVGNSIVAMGPKGNAFLENILIDKSEDVKLRQNAFMVLRIPQPCPIFAYVQVTVEQDDKIWSHWPKEYNGCSSPNFW